MLNHFVCENIGIKPGIRGPSMVTGGIIGLMGGFMYAYQNSAGRIMGFFPNDGEVARYKKWHHFFGFFNKSLNLSLFSDKFLFFPWCFVLILCFNDDNNSQKLLCCITLYWENTKGLLFPKTLLNLALLVWLVCVVNIRMQCFMILYIYNRVEIWKSYLMWKSM